MYQNLIKQEGTKAKSNTIYVSSGVISLDHLIGGGVSVGTIILVEQDILGTYGKVINRLFLAEGATCKHDLFIASADENPDIILKELPVPITPEETEMKIDNDKMQIAWRYQELPVVETSFGTNSLFGHNFDLSRHIDDEQINECCIYTWIPSSIKNNYFVFTNPMYAELLKSINEKTRSSSTKILRICINSLGSPIWRANESCSESNGEDIIKFMYLLRLLIRNTRAVVLVALQSHLFENEDTIKRITYSVDTAVRLESFAGSDKETNPAFKDYHGLLYITKLSAYNTLASHIPSSLDLAFKLRRKKFIIENLHLPPELQESKEREQDDLVMTSLGCGLFGKKNIDF